MSHKHWVISVFIILVLGFQASTFVTGTKVWPFMAYAMYADAKNSVVQFRIEATFADGETLLVDETVIGVDYFAWRTHYLYVFGRGDFSPVPTLLEEIEAYAGRAPQRVVMEIVDYRLIGAELEKHRQTVVLHPREDLP